MIAETDTQQAFKCSLKISRADVNWNMTCIQDFAMQCHLKFCRMTI